VGAEMLQNTPNDWVNRDNLPPPEFRRAPAVSLVEVVAFLRRRLSIILLTCLATLGIAALYLITVVPTFTAKAVIIVNSKETPGDPAAVSTIVESQIAIIKSEGIASAVIEKLGLAQDPELATGQGSGMISRLLGWSRPETKASAVRYAVESFERKLSTKRVGPTYLVEITFDSKDPDRAAQILNAVVERYITYQMGNAQDETWTKDRLNELRTQALAAQNALEDYSKNTKEPADSAATIDKLAAAAESSKNAYDNFRQMGNAQDETWTKDRLNELRTQALAAQSALEDYSKNTKEPADSAATIDKLAAAAKSSKNAYDNFLHMLRKMEAIRQQSSPVFEASLVTGASPPLRASSPKLRSVLAIAIVVGGILGIAIGVLRDLSETLAVGREPRLSAQDDGIERPIPDVVRPDHQSEASAKTRPVRLTGSG
jgi:uncharacterized protein involved in exopolysaccharide biosynthesis